MEKKQLTEEQIISRRASQNKWRQKNKEIYNANQNEYTKLWYQKNREKVLAKKKEMYVSVKEQKPEDHIPTYYELNKEKLLQKAKEKYALKKQKPSLVEELHFGAI